MKDEKPAEPVRVLIVDDEENQRLGLASMVAGWGYEAATPADGQEALEKLADVPRSGHGHRPHRCRAWTAPSCCAD